MPVQKKPSDINNVVIAFVLSTLIFISWSIFIDAPRKKAEALNQKMQEQSQTLNQPAVQGAGAEAPLPLRSRAEWVNDSPRVHIDSSRLHGSIALKGLRFDDLTLARYHETLNPSSPEVTLFSPANDANGYFAEFGWLAVDGAPAVKLPGADSVWKASGDTLTPSHPVTFTFDNGEGIIFSTTVSLDDNYMFSLTQSAVGKDGKETSLRHYAYINRVYDTKAHPSINILQEGPLGVFDGTLSESPYKKLVEDKEKSFEASSGWMGITDKYWLAAIVPAREPFSGRFSAYNSKAREHFQVDYVSQPQTQTTLHFFAGAKELTLLDAYAAEYDIPLFDRAVDFGLFWFLAKPIFLVLEYFHALVGNFGIAILILTVLVKLIMFPLASKSFGAMNQMKELQPKLKEIQARHKDDKIRMNQDIMALYKKEKVNPASGCLPMFIQIPVFFSLYKVLYVSIEMRQAPFYGWIHDLSAPDPTNLFTLFGLLNWTPPTVMHLGIWPILMCATMVIQQNQSPPPPDPVQAKMMKALPFIFLFMFSNVAAGLVIYWTWSNSISILQQWYIKYAHTKRKIKKLKSQ